MPQVEVRSRAPGPSGEPMPTVMVELENDRITPRELIRRAVEEQLRALRFDPSTARAALDRQYLVGGASGDGPGGGTGAGGSPEAGPDPAVEVERAVRAFADGALAVYADGRRLTGLDEAAVVGTDQAVVFLRLVPLTNG